LPQKTLRHLINMVHFSMAQQDIRYYLNGMLMVFEPGFLRVVATDAHRLAYCATEIESVNASHAEDSDAASIEAMALQTEALKTEEMNPSPTRASEALHSEVLPIKGRDASEVIVPRKTVLELQRLLEESEAPVAIDVAQNQIRFRFGKVELISKLVEGKFPDYTRVIPNTYTRHFLINREALQQSLQRAAILITDKVKGVRVQLMQNQMKVSSSNAEQEEAHEEIDITYPHEPLDIGFNVNYLLDVLANVKTQNVKWLMEPNQNASTLITLPDHDRFKYVVMPMRI